MYDWVENLCETNVGIYLIWDEIIWSCPLTCLLSAPACWGCAGWWWCPAGRSRSVCWVVLWWSAGRGPCGDTPAPRCASRPCRTVGPGLTEASPVSRAGLHAWTTGSLQGGREEGRISFFSYGFLVLFVIACMCWFKVEVLTEVDEKASVALALILWKNHDAWYVVFLLTVLLLKKKDRNTFHH